jgi:hypothetical protein
MCLTGSYAPRSALECSLYRMSYVRCAFGRASSPQLRSAYGLAAAQLQRHLFTPSVHEKPRKAAFRNPEIQRIPLLCLACALLAKRGYVQNTHNIYLWGQGLSAISPGHPVLLGVAPFRSTPLGVLMPKPRWCRAWPPIRFFLGLVLSSLFWFANLFV